VKTVRRALVFSFLEKYAQIAITLASFFVIARLLTPKEVGVYSVSAALIGIAQVIREFGVGNYLIQKKDLTAQHVATAFGFTLLLGFGTFLIFQLAAPQAGTFYADEQLVAVVRIVAINFLLLPVCSISLALLRREMLFGKLMAVNTTAVVIGAATSMLLAWANFGPLSLAWGSVASNLATGLGAWLARNDRKLIAPSLRQWREIVSFGGQSTIAAVVTSVAMDINDLVVGKVLGLAPVAVLSRAQGLMNLMHRDLMGAVRNVAYPAFALMHRSGEDIEPKFIATITSITAFAWPFYGFIAIYPLEILRIMFGTQWDAASPLVPVFAAAGAFSALYSLIPSIMLATGRIDLVTKSELIFQPLRASIIVFFAIYFQTLLACAIGFLISFILALPVFLAFKHQCVKNDFKSLYLGLRKSLLLSVLSLGIPFAYSTLAGLTRTQPIALSEFAGVCAFTALAWFMSIVALRHPIATDPLFVRIRDRIPFISK
jgi:lipopolysaccharide exporter